MGSRSPSKAVAAVAKRVAAVAKTVAAGAVEDASAGPETWLYSVKY